MRLRSKYSVRLTTALTATDNLPDDLRGFVIHLSSGDDFSETLRGNP